MAFRIVEASLDGVERRPDVVPREHLPRAIRAAAHRVGHRGEEVRCTAPIDVSSGCRANAASRRASPRVGVALIHTSRYANRIESSSAGTGEWRAASVVRAILR